MKDNFYYDAYILQSDEYNSEAPMKWKKLEMTWYDAVREYAGNKTIMLLWGRVNDTDNNQLVIRSFADTTHFAGVVADNIIHQLKQNLLK